MILAPKFLEFITLSILAFIHNNYLLHCIYLFIVCFVLRNTVPEPLFDEFQEQVFEESEVSLAGTRQVYSCLFCSMKKIHDRSKLACTYARNYYNLFDYSLKTP
jgi:hypothetical protein